MNDPGHILREWMTIVAEAAEPALPAKLQKLLDQPIPMTLKDGRTGQLTIARADLGLTVSCRVDGDYAGGLLISANNVPPPEAEVYDLYQEDRGSWSVSSLHVNAPYRRQGIATAMYDMLARAGLKILRSGSGYGGKMLPDGDRLWQSRDEYKKPRGHGFAKLVRPRFWKLKPKPKA